MTNRAFRFTRGLVGGLALLVAIALALAGLSACGAPAYTYVTDSAASTYYKVPYGWHAITSSSLNKELQAEGNSSSGVWATAFDANSSPTANHFLAFGANDPFVFSEVGRLTSDESNSLSYNELRDFMLPVTSSSRQSYAQQGVALRNFQQVRDQTITAKQGVHGVRETFRYTYEGLTDTFDEVVLTNAAQTIVYFLIVHCMQSCYSQHQSDIDTVMTSFTVGSLS